jgi:peptidoglycan/LPS O-acetylase OafA/YrhL
VASQLYSSSFITPMLGGRSSSLLETGYASFPVFKYGWLGVEIFFMISGFVILMTLERWSSFKEFIGKRWLRLFPGMLVCSALIFLTVPVFSGRPAGLPSLRDLLPGLTFIEPSILAYIFGSAQGVLEGSFWTIFVEFKYYVIFGSLYFLIGRNYSLVILCVIFIAASRMTRLITRDLNIDILTNINDFAIIIDGAILYLVFGRVHIIFMA